MEQVEDMNEDAETSAFVDSLTSLAENTSAFGIRLLALEEYCNSTQTYTEILKTKINLLSDTNGSFIKTRDELLIRNRRNIISLESLFNFLSLFCNYKCDVKEDYIRKEREIKNKRTQYDKIITSYKMKWEAVELEYEKSPIAAELSVLEQENIFRDAEARRLDDLFTKTKADYLESYNQWWHKLITKTLDFATEYQTYTMLVKVTDEIWKKNMKLQELQKIESCEAPQPQVIRKYCDYFNSSPLVISMLANTKGKDTSKYSFDLTSFDEISIPQENLEMETEDESFFNSYENGRSFDITQKARSVCSPEMADSVSSPVENVDPVAVQDEYSNENCDYDEVTEHDTRANSNYFEDKGDAFHEDISRTGPEAGFMNVNENRFELRNQYTTAATEVTTQSYVKLGRNKSESGEAIKSIDIENSEKNTESFKLKKGKETRKNFPDDDEEIEKSEPKKRKYSFKTKNTQDSPQIYRVQKTKPSDTHMNFDFDFKEFKDFTHEKNQEREESKFSFFLKTDSSTPESTSMFNLF